MLQRVPDMPGEVRASLVLGSCSINKWLHCTVAGWNLWARLSRAVVRTAGLQGGMALALSQLEYMPKHIKPQSRSLCDVAAISAADSVRLAGCRGRESVQSASAT